MRDEIWKSTFLQMLPVVYRDIMSGTIELNDGDVIHECAAEVAGKFANQAVEEYKKAEDKLPF